MAFEELIKKQKEVNNELREEIGLLIERLDDFDAALDNFKSIEEAEEYVNSHDLEEGFKHIELF